MNINSDMTINQVGDQWMVLSACDGVVHVLSGAAAIAIDCVSSGRPIPAGCDDAVAVLVDTGVFMPPSKWSRRKVLATAATAAAVGITTAALPTAVAAASLSPEPSLDPAPSTTAAPPDPPPEPSNISFSEPGETELTVSWVGV